MDKETHNGWTNYATWRVNIELVDSIGWVKEDIVPAEQKLDITDICSFLQNMAEDAVTQQNELEGLAVDYALAFLAEVNWAEIARNLIKNYPALME